MAAAATSIATSVICAALDSAIHNLSFAICITMGTMLVQIL
jgi:hypothetical protein